MAKILVVDDDGIVRASLRRALEKEGHQVAELGDGDGALKTVSADRPDLIVLEALLPGLDGMSLAYHLKFESRFKRIPILMLTTLGDPQTERYSRESAVDCFMSKPVDAAKVRRKVAELLNSNKIRVGAAPAATLEKTPGTGILKPVMFFLAGTLAVAAMLLNTQGVAHSESLNAQFNPAAASRLADVIFIALVPVALLILFGHTYLLSRLLRGKRR